MTAEQAVEKAAQKGREFVKIAKEGVNDMWDAERDDNDVDFVRATSKRGARDLRILRDLADAPEVAATVGVGAFEALTVSVAAHLEWFEKAMRELLGDSLDVGPARCARPRSSRSRPRASH